MSNVCQPIPDPISAAIAAFLRGFFRRRLKQYWNRLKELRRQKLNRDQLLMKIGAAKKQAGNASKLVELSLPAPHPPVSPETFCFSLCKGKLRIVRRQEGQYLLRSNLISEEASTLRKYYIQLVEVEQAFKNLKSDLSLRPIYHQKDPRIEAQIFVAFLSYCLTGNAAAAIESSCTRLDGAINPGEICFDSTCRCSSADYGWQRTSIAPIYGTE